MIAKLDVYKMGDNAVIVAHHPPTGEETLIRLSYVDGRLLATDFRTGRPLTYDNVLEALWDIAHGIDDATAEFIASKGGKR